MLKSFEVKSYESRVGRSVVGNYIAAIYCYGNKNELVSIYFHKTDDPNVEPYDNEVNINNMRATVFVPYYQYPIFIDLLRNESPIYALLDSDRPQYINISTGAEPVGDNDLRI